MPRLAVHLVGSPRIELDGEPIDIRRRKAIALLAYLAVTGQSHGRDALATLLWPELDQSRARAGLRRALTALRKALGEDFLDIDRETVGLNRDADIWLDVAEFQDRLAECRTHGHPDDETCPACLPLLAEATVLYRDDFLVGFTLPDSPAFDEWQFFQSEGLHSKLASVLEHLARAHSGRSEFEPAIAHARRWLALDPLHEPAHRCLMRLYAWSGQRAAALRQYGECERVLRGELGVSPEAETIRLYEAVEENRELPVPAAPISPQPIVRKHHLPVQLTPFVGREAMLTGISNRLRDPDCRLLTLIGPGGSGKTRLAVEAAAAQLDNYTHGVFFVSLAPLQSVEAIVPTVAETLSFSFYTGAGGAIDGGPEQPISAKQQLLDYLRQKAMLIIMDNFEHLLDGVGLVTEILETVPDVKILATSRERLNVQGEQLFPVAGMAFPDWETPADALDYSAVKLFMQSAQRVRPDFELKADDLRYVAHICRLAGGMPLAILLAAAWVQMLTPREIAAEIGQGIDFLETDLRDVPERQRSIRAVFDHSWRLLTEREREVLQALSVFRGGFTRHAAQEVAGASLQVLMALANKSLLHRASVGRYELHELLRRYAAERLDQSLTAGQAARDQHCACYAAALQEWGEDLKGPRQQAALGEMDVEIENARAAWNWAAEQRQVERLDQAMDGLCRFYEWRVRYWEGEAACRMAAEKLAATVSGDGPVLSAVEGLQVLAKILVWQGGFNMDLDRTELASELLQQSLALLEGPELAGQDTRPEKAFALQQMGYIASDYSEAKQSHEQSLALYQALGNRWEAANELESLGWAVFQLSVDGEVKDIMEVRQLFEESMAIRRALGDQRGVSSSLMGLGIAFINLSQFEEGERLYRESLAISREIGDRVNIANGLSNLGSFLAHIGQFAEAHSLLEESVVVCNDVGDRWRLAWSIAHLGLARAHLGRYEQARVQGQMSLALSREIDFQHAIAISLDVLGVVALAAKAYAEAHQLWQEGVSVFRPIRPTVATGRALAGLGLAARGLGNMPEAQQHLYEALRAVRPLATMHFGLATMHSRLAAIHWCAPPLAAIALLLADQGERERAVELYALVSCCALVANSRWWEDVAGRHLAAVAATLPSQVVAAAQERGRARDLEATVAELLEELGK